jgi:hypothetical protein
MTCLVYIAAGIVIVAFLGCLAVIVIACLVMFELSDRGPSNQQAKGKHHD